jgi:hypothetical protein
MRYILPPFIALVLLFSSEIASANNSSENPIEEGARAFLKLHVNHQSLSVNEVDASTFFSGYISGIAYTIIAEQASRNGTNWAIDLSHTSTGTQFITNVAKYLVDHPSNDKSINPGTLVIVALAKLYPSS